MVWEFQAHGIRQLSHSQDLDSPRLLAAILYTVSARTKQKKNKVSVFLSELQMHP